MTKYHWEMVDSKGIPLLGPFDSDKMPDNELILKVTELKLYLNCEGCNKSWQEWVKDGCPFADGIKENPIIVYALHTSHKHKRE